MSFLVCVVPVSPMRADASHRSEQVSQLLFGETAELLESGKNFTRIRCIYDGYEGWCQTGQLLTIDEDHQPSFSNLMCAEWAGKLTFNGKPMIIPFGSTLSVF